MNTAVYLDAVELRILLVRYKVDGLVFFQSANEAELSVAAVEQGITRMAAQGLLTAGEDDHFMAGEVLQQDMKSLQTATCTILVSHDEGVNGTVDPWRMCLYPAGDNILTISRDTLHQDMLRLEQMTWDEFGRAFDGVKAHAVVYQKGSDTAEELNVKTMEELRQILGRDGT